MYAYNYKNTVKNCYTLCTMEFDKIHWKETTSTGPDMHSFWRFDKFEPKSVRLCQIFKTTNNWNLSNHQNETRDWVFEEIIWIGRLVRKCQIFKTGAYQATLYTPYWLTFSIIVTKIENSTFGSFKNFEFLLMQFHAPFVA